MYIIIVFMYSLTDLWSQPNHLAPCLSTVVCVANNSWIIFELTDLQSLRSQW